MDSPDPLQVIFQHDGVAGWSMQLLPHGMPARPVRPWREPRKLDRYRPFLSIFEEDPDLAGRPWRLRLRRRDGDRPGPQELPDVPTWAWLYHPDQGCHVLDIHWTVSQLVAEPVRGETSGIVAVVEDQGLTTGLRKMLGSRVQGVNRTSLPPRSLVVVPITLPEAEARQVQARALEAECPLIIWCGDVRPPLGEIAEVVPLATPREPRLPWLVRFLHRLLRGHDPEQAFAMAGLRGPPEDRRARWLRGAFSNWRVDPPEGSLPEGWFTHLDRSKQSTALNAMVLYLAQPQAARRVQVVLTPGPDRAGLERFRKRALAFPQDVPPIPISEMDLSWTDDVANQALVLLWAFKAQGRTDLLERILEEARKVHQQSRSQAGQRVLFWVRHETVTLDREVAIRHGLRAVTLAELRRYFEFLQALAAQLAGYQIRFLVHISVQDASEDELHSAKVEERFFRTNVLPALDECVPQDELKEWLSVAELSYTLEDLKVMSGLAYDDLIDWLVSRYQLEAV